MQVQARQNTPAYQAIPERRVARALSKYSINTPESINLLKRRIEIHNLKAKSAGEKIKGVHAMLAEKIIQLYKIRFRKWQASELYDVELSEMPTLLLNNQFLGDVMTVTGRTIQNYRKRLKGLGFILSEVWHGSDRPFEVRINPDFLYIVSNREGGKRANLPNGAQSFPLIGSMNSHSNLKEQSHRTIRGTISAESGKMAASEAKEPKAAASKAKERVSENDQSDVNSPEKPKKFDKILTEKRKTVLIRHSKTVYYVAENSLFGRNVPPELKQLAFNRIMELYGNSPMEKFGKITQNYCQRIRLAAEYWQEEHGDLPPIHQFFNRENFSGFVRTRGWIEKYKDSPTLSTQGVLRNLSEKLFSK
jgi:hypothetical protein